MSPSSLSWPRCPVWCPLAIGAFAVVMVAGPAAAEPPKKSWLAAEAPLVAPRTGVAVVAMGATPTDVWPVALAVYGRPRLRPRLDDRAARVLAGEAALDADAEPVKELAALRAKVDADDAPSRAMLAEVGRRTNTWALVVVSRPESGVQARIYDVKDDRLEATLHRPDPGATPFGPLAAALELRYAPPDKAPEPKETPKPAPLAPPKESTSFHRSPWFWGALGAAAAAGLTVWLVTRNSGTSGTPHVEWATK